MPGDENVICVQDPRSSPDDTSSTARSYWVFDPKPFDFPPPRVPLLPGLSLHSIGWPRDSKYAVVGGDVPRQEYRRGRYALRDAYKAAGVAHGSAILIPAYHCRTMLDPAISLGGQVLLYHLNSDLQPDLASMEAAIARSEYPVKAMLVTHYFGFAQNLESAVGFCRQRNICLIEDCSHALIEAANHPRIGRSGTFTITSPYKFFPCEEGGWLIARTRELDANRQRGRPHLRAELGTLRDVLNHALPAATNALPDPKCDTRAKWVAPLTDSWRTENQAGTSTLYNLDEQAMLPTIASRLLAAICSPDTVAMHRRENYLRWTEAMSSIRNARPLWPKLPKGTVPYMFPLLIDRPESDFPRLKRLGIPIWRWDEMATSSCSVAQSYRLRLLHLPCHQSLTSRQLNWMIDALSCVVGS